MAKREANRPKITPADVYELFRKRTGLPDFIIFRDKKIKAEEIKEYFSRRIFGQEEAVNDIVGTIISLKAELNDPGKPVAVFLFVGPTGVGKTALARLLAEYLFGTDKKLLRYDMPEFAGYAGFTRLIVGMGNKPGRLVGDVLANPFSVILLDEIEKASEQVFNLLLPVMGEGRLTDEMGRTTSFQNTIIIMTSNVGAELYSSVPFGFLRPDMSDEVKTTEKQVIEKVKEYFRPEFINRLTRIVQFKPLSREGVRLIAQQEVEKVVHRRGIASRNLKVKVADNVFEFLISIGYSQEYGARPMQRAVERYFGYPLAVAISTGDITEGDTVEINIDDSQKVNVVKK